MNNSTPHEPTEIPDLPADPAVDQRLDDAFTQLRMDAGTADAMGALRRHESHSDRPWYLSPGPMVVTASLVLALVVGGFVLFGNNNDTTTIETPDAVVATDGSDDAADGDGESSADVPDVSPEPQADATEVPAPSTVSAATPTNVPLVPMPRNLPGTWLLELGVDRTGRVFYPGSDPEPYEVRFAEEQFTFSGSCTSAQSAVERAQCQAGLAALELEFSAAHEVAREVELGTDRLVWSGGSVRLEFVRPTDVEGLAEASGDPVPTPEPLPTPIPTATPFPTPTAVPTSTPEPTPTPEPLPQLTPGAGPFIGTWALQQSLDVLIPPGQQGPITTISEDGFVRFDAYDCARVRGQLLTDGVSRLEVDLPFVIDTSNCGPDAILPDQPFFDIQLFSRAEIVGDQLIWRMADGEEVGMGDRAMYQRAQAPPTAPTAVPTAEATATAPDAGMTLGAGPFAGSWQMIREHDALYPPGEGPTLTLGADGFISGTAGCNTFTGQVQSDGGSQLAVVVGTGNVTIIECGVDTERAANYASIVAMGTNASIRDGNLIWEFGGGAEMEFVRTG